MAFRNWKVVVADILAKGNISSGCINAGLLAIRDIISLMTTDFYWF